MSGQHSELFKSKVLGHPSGLFVLFFTEMWERFSYYGMRALLVMFLTASLTESGWGWPREHAFALFGTYTALVYISTMLGGYFADKIWGYRKAVVVGAVLMTLGHGAMALETTWSIYVGLTLLVFGSGFFKPNMTSIISHMYKDHQEKKDGAYTIFYMGVNAGAFLGILLCGYLGEKVGWSIGFGLAGVFMLFGMIQFVLSQNIFGDIGLKPSKVHANKGMDIGWYLKVLKQYADFSGRSRRKEYWIFTLFNIIFVILASFIDGVLGLGMPLFYVVYTLAMLVPGLAVGVRRLHDVGKSGWMILIALIPLIGGIWLLVLMVTDSQAGANKWGENPKKITPVSNPDVLEENSTVAAPEIIDAKVNNAITAEDGSDGKDTLPFPLWQKILIAIMTTAGLVWILNDPAAMIYDFNVLNFEFLGMSGPNFTILLALVSFLFLLIYRLTQYGQVTRHKMLAVWFFAFLTIFFWAIFEQAPGSLTVFARDYTNRDLAGGAALTFKIINTLMTLIPLGIITWVLGLLFRQTFKKYAMANVVLGFSFVIIWAVAIWMLVVEFQQSTAEVPASWFGVLNSLFIIAMAPLFSRWWESKYNPSANMKFGIGLSLLGIGMACVAYGAGGIAPGAQTAAVSMVWLILVYFFHTMGELCISPVGLSYVSKLVPGKMIAFMFGIWYIAVAIGMKSAGKFSEYSESVANEEGISYFFWILTIVPIALGLLSIAMTPVIKKLMHGVK